MQRCGHVEVHDRVVGSEKERHAVLVHLREDAFDEVQLETHDAGHANEIPHGAQTGVTVGSRDGVEGHVDELQGGRRGDVVFGGAETVLRLQTPLRQRRQHAAVQSPGEEHGRVVVARHVPSHGALERAAQSVARTDVDGGDRSEKEPRPSPRRVVRVATSQSPHHPFSQIEHHRASAGELHHARRWRHASDDERQGGGRRARDVDAKAATSERVAQQKQPAPRGVVVDERERTLDAFEQTEEKEVVVGALRRHPIDLGAQPRRVGRGVVCLEERAPRPVAERIVVRDVVVALSHRRVSGSGAHPEDLTVEGEHGPVAERRWLLRRR